MQDRITDRRRVPFATYGDGRPLDVNELRAVGALANGVSLQQGQLRHQPTQQTSEGADRTASDFSFQLPSGGAPGHASTSPSGSPQNPSLSPTNRTKKGMTFPYDGGSHAKRAVGGFQTPQQEREDTKSSFIGLSLHAAAAVDQVQIAELLLEAGANLYATDANGRTALHVAAQNGGLSFLQLLLKQDAEVQGREEKAQGHKVEQGLGESGRKQVVDGVCIGKKNRARSRLRKNRTRPQYNPRN